MAYARRVFGAAAEAAIASALERRMDTALREAGIRFTLHWSNNSGIDPEKLEYMYGAEKIASWKAARHAVFENDEALMQMFGTDAMARAGLA